MFSLVIERPHQIWLAVIRQMLIEYQNFALEITFPCNLVFLLPGIAKARDQTPSGSVKDPQKDHVHTVSTRSPHGLHTVRDI